MSDTVNPVEAILGTKAGGKKKPSAPKPTKAPTTALAQDQAQAAVAIEQRTKRNRDDLIAQEKIEVTIPPMYRPHFGMVMDVGLNGLTIHVPCDGKPYKVPADYAGIIKGRMRAVNDMLGKQSRLANIQGNKESYAGELTLIPK